MTEGKIYFSLMLFFSIILGSTCLELHADVSNSIINDVFYLFSRKCSLDWDSLKVDDPELSLRYIKNI